MDDTISSHRQKKHTSALLKTQHRNTNISKRTLEFSKDKGKLKTYRNQERQQKNNISTDETRQYYCNYCKVWNNVVECNGCYVDWCGVNGDYYQCDFGQHDLCQYHISNFHININTNGYASYWEYQIYLKEQEYEDRISYIQWRGLIADALLSTRVI